MTNTGQCDVAYEENKKIIADEHLEITEQLALVRNLVSNSQADIGQIIAALRGLLNLTRSHFEHEEAIMMANNFPGMLLHKRDHDYLVGALSNFMASFVDGTVTLSPQIGDNLQSWKEYHIKKFDNAYLEFKALSSSPEINAHP